MTTCANALVEEIGLSSVGDEHDTGSEDESIDYDDDSYDIGIIEKDLDITVFLDQELPVEDDDDEFGDDYVDADDDDADGRKLRLFSPKKEAARKSSKCRHFLS